MSLALQLKSIYMPNNLNFNISLSVLNHLGRNLYRNFATVIGEAISNGWDANANNIWITIDREKNEFWIRDDGDGMDFHDFQDKFLKVGYSKRRRGRVTSPAPYNRPYIGNKGIGKLALLSCANKITVISRKSDDVAYVGGSIDNSELNDKIDDDLDVHDYELGSVDMTLFDRVINNHTHGTIIHFGDINNDIRSTDESLRKIIALYFRFTLIDKKFNIYLDGRLVTLEALKELAGNTQFIWPINNWKDDPYIDMCENIKSRIDVSMSASVTGFIASVNKPKNRNIHSTGEKVGVDLYVNGRVRETDILKHIPSSQVPESYLYGQIHFDSLDSGTVDRFTSSREGILANDTMFKDFLEELRKVVFTIMDAWDKLRDEQNQDGDPDNDKRETVKTKKSKSLYREVKKEFEGESGENGDDFLMEMTDDAAFNVTSYIECFIAENLLRRYIRDNGEFTDCLNIDLKSNTCQNRNPDKSDSWCRYCKAQGSCRGFHQLKKDAKMNIGVRRDEDDMLMYMDYLDLAGQIDDSVLKEEDKPYKPLRNSVMHTSRLTEEAKTRLRSVFDSVVATVTNFGNGKKP